ncbi:RHS repeat domain-containing protein, partial [Acinetobacter baumannii]|nr:RHS repeat domain-containing protein [Acinetobacter baumannii]
MPSTLRGFGDGNFEVELSIDGQVYKKSVASGSSLVEIALDNNTDKFLGGKNYTVKIYKRTSATTTELVMNTTNKVTDKIALTYTGASYWSELPPMFYSKVGDLFEFEEQTVNQEGTLNNYSHLMMKNIPTGTSRVEVKYKVVGVSQWSTLTSSAGLYNNTAGWYKAGLNTLENNTLYDYQYLAYNAKGDILGGGQGVINTALNQATITQKALAATDLPSVYIDKQEIVNNKQDAVKGEFIPENTVIFPSLNMPERLTDRNSNIKFKYTFNNNFLNKYYGNDFVFIFEDTEGRGVKKYINFSKNLVGDNTEVYIDLSPQELNEISPIKYQGNNGSSYGEYKITLAQIISNNFSPVAAGVQKVYYRHSVIGGEDRYSYWFGSSTEEGLLFSPKDNIRLYNQPAGTTQVIAYYRELGSNNAYTQIDAKPLMDVYGQPIAGAFDINFNSVLDSTKKYEIQYVALAGKDIVNRQQGTIEFNSAGMQVNTTPLNYGGDGFILFSGTDVQFIDQFKPVTSASTSAKLKIRKVGTTVWEQFALTGTSDWFSWNGNQGRDGEYEFQLDSFNGTTQTTPSGSIIGKLRLGSQPKVLSYIPKSFAQNQITFAGQPTGSSKVTVKYGTAAGLLNKTAVLTVGSDGKAILDATDLAEQNLLGSTTVYYSYETTDANGKLLNRATGYVNVGVGAGSGQHTNQLNDSWLDFQPAQNNGSKMELFYRKRQVDASGNFVSDLVSADINSDAYWASSNQFQKVSLTPSNGIYRWNLNDLVPKSGFENYEYFYQLYDSAGKVIAFVPGKLSIDSKGNGSSQQNKWVINGSGDRASQIVKSQAYNAFGEIISETDGNGNTSSLSYNTMGKLTKKVLPTVDIRKSDGTVVQGTPTLEYGYDLSGRLLTSKDANGNINKQSYLNGRNLETGDWLVEKETHADTGEVSNLYDVYGNLIEQSNALGVKTGYSYDINGNLIQITRAARTAGTVGANHITSGG